MLETSNPVLRTERNTILLKKKKKKKKKKQKKKKYLGISISRKENLKTVRQCQKALMFKEK